MKKFLCILLVSILLIASTTTSEALGILNALTKEPEITYKELKIGDIAKTDYAEVKTNKDAPLLLKFTLPSSEGKVGFAYVIR